MPSAILAIDMTIKDARLLAGITQRQMSDRLDIPVRSIENWEAGDRKPPAYVEKLIIDKLLQLAEQKAERISLDPEKE